MYRRSSIFWDVTQRRFVVICRRFGTSYRSHIQGSSSPRPLNKGLIGCPETSVTNYQSALHNILKEWGSWALFWIYRYKKLKLKATKTFIFGFYSTVEYIFAGEFNSLLLMSIQRIVTLVACKHFLSKSFYIMAVLAAWLAKGAHSVNTLWHRAEWYEITKDELGFV
jgi:hypothetical protein